nr:metallophosphoesterase [Kofleriaceae bacterium]
MAACDRGHPESTPPPVSAPSHATAAVGSVGSSAASAPAAVSVAGCTLTPHALRTPAPKRLVAIGDIHGDIAAARAALHAAGATSQDDHWIGGDLVVVQTGDILDRGNDESAILEMFARLATEAHDAGGAVIQLVGNHELMNAAHDFRYVTPGGHQDFGGDRAGQLGPGGAWAKRLADHDAIAIVGDTVFSHAGVVGEWAAHVDQANLETRCWLAGQTQQVATLLTSDDSPVWTRALGMPGQTDCKLVDDALAKLGAKRMVVAHTVQKDGITSDCDGKLWRIDVGMTKMFGGPIEVLEIKAAAAGDVVTALHGHRD